MKSFVEMFFQSNLKAVDENYLKSRTLRSSWTSTLHLIFFGVGIVITGEFAAWNAGLSYGWSSLVVATIMVNIYYWCLLLCLAELSSALPFSGGSLTFITATMGNIFGYILGLVVLMQNVLAYSQSSILVSNFYIRLIHLSLEQTVYWKYILNFLVIFISSIIAIDLKVFHRVITILTVIAVLEIVFIFCAMIPVFSKGDFLFNTGLLNTDSFLPDGVMGVLNCMPFAIWFFVGIESLPNLAEEAKDPATSLPKAMLGGYAILTLSVLLVLMMVGCNPGSSTLQSSIDPLSDIIFSNYDIIPRSLIGILIQFFFSFAHHASTVGFTIGTIRIMYALSRGGYFPTFLSITHQGGDVDSYGYGSPLYAIIASGAGAYCMIILSFLLGETILGSFLLYGCAFYSLVAAIFVFISYTLLKVRSPHLERHFNLSDDWKSILVPILGLILGGIAISGFFTSNPNNTIVFYILIAQFVISFIYYIFVVRHRLVLSAEQKFIKLRIAKLREETLKKHHDEQVKVRLDSKSRNADQSAVGKPAKSMLDSYQQRSKRASVLQ
ncbi:amino acid permease-domain-containing protein [Globomyces pollinis-pini]|nr:amino acid permease-domain-containing protein [Globomyces pollinis-pini]